MSPCLLHPHIEAVGSCEYCGGPHCGQCLRVLLGRRYCPPCYQRVDALATGRPVPGDPAAGPGPGTSGGPPPAARTGRPPLPGWASALLYVVLFIVVDKVVAESVLAVPLIAAKYATGGLLAGKPMTERVLMDPAGLGVPLWSFFWGLIGWGSLLVTLGLTAALAHWLEKRSLGELGLRPQGRMARDLLAGLGLAAVFFVSVAGVGAARGLYTVHFAAPDADAAAIAGVGFILLLPFAAVEEISMRGYVLNAASRSWGKAGGLAASTLLFAGLHGFNPHFKDQPLALAGLLLAGLYLGSAYLITGNLWFPIFLHTGWNLLEGPVFGFPVSGNALSISIFHSASTGPKLWTGGSFGPEAGLLLCLLMAVHIAALWAMSPALRPRGPAAEPPAGGEAPSRVEAEASYRAIPIR